MDHSQPASNAGHQNKGDAIDFHFAHKDRNGEAYAISLVTPVCFASSLSVPAPAPTTPF